MENKKNKIIKQQKQEQPDEHNPDIIDIIFDVDNDPNVDVFSESAILFLTIYLYHIYFNKKMKKKIHKHIPFCKY